ncbi:MAG: HAD family hydrolase [Dysgonamonadaceae bacterium]|jgi:putative hydrolase of the HAD superfamily|nr:HAD family hydrolase [Dysgonamonadaceae bacterium]
MISVDKIKGIILDYGATIDTNGKHWGEVLWNAYQENQIPVSKASFRDAYVYGERYLATHPVIQAHYTFKDLLLAKTEIQIKWLIENNFLPDNDNSSAYSFAISNRCYNFVRSVLKNIYPVLEKLASQYPLVLVSNFYGNIEAVLKDFSIDLFFIEIIESAVVKIRKPDPDIFSLGVKALQLKPSEVVVVGDSYKKDIVPAQMIGCQTIWLKGEAWEPENSENKADAVIYDFKELEIILLSSGKTL